MKREREEKTKVEFKRYRTPWGEPTCALDFVHEKVCVFYHKIRRSGQAGLLNDLEICVCDRSVLNRREPEENMKLGYLIPSGTCCLW